MRKLTLFVIATALLLVVAGCSKKPAASDDTARQTQQSTPPPQPPPGQPTVAREPSLVALSAGAFIVKSPQEYSSAYSAIELLDERGQTNWSSPRGNVGPQTLVLALPERTLLKSVEFDCAFGVSYAGSCAKDVSVEMSDVGENDGFKTIAEGSLKEGADKQRFPVSAEVPGRWVRLNIKNNHGSPDFIQLNDFRAYGTQLTHTSPPDVSGSYDSDLGYVYLRQQGTSVTGCYYTRGGIFDGGIEGPLVKLTWCDNCTQPNKTRGPAILVFSPDRKRFLGLWWNEGSENAGGHWAGIKKSDTVGKCPQWSGGAEEQLTKDLEEFGRARVYGINFDVDSDRIKDESKPTLDKLVAILKAKPDWKLTIEGHTDSTSTPEHNQQLSERRAAAVKNYLQTASINGSRLQTAGFGATRPVSSNDTELGRAQNRRVELAKQ